MAKAKVVLTDYVWESLEVEHEILGSLADIVPLQVTDPEACAGREFHSRIHPHEFSTNSAGFCPIFEN